MQLVLHRDPQEPEVPECVFDRPVAWSVEEKLSLLEVCALPSLLVCCLCAFHVGDESERGEILAHP